MTLPFDPVDQGWPQLGELVLAFVLSALVGLEREVRHKAAGLRTHTLVGVAAALFMLISKHGFTNVLEPGRVVLDPSRVAAQVVSGIGFIGGGVIFMRRDVVRGLTTAASIWLTAALGMACGAGLVLLALATVGGHFVIMLVFPALLRRVPGRRREEARLRLLLDGRAGLLPAVLAACTEARFAIEHVEVERGAPDSAEAGDPEGAEPEPAGALGLVLGLRGRRPVAGLVARLGGMPGVLRAATAEDGLE